MIRSRYRMVLSALVLVGLYQAPARAQKPAAAPKARVGLLSSVEAIVPGESFELGVRFELEDEWHIYWQNSGDSGMPPDVEWTLPAGLTVGPARYPIPKRHHSPGDIVTNILPGAPMLLFTATLEPSVADGSVTVGAKVTGFVFREKCLSEQTEVSVELSVLPPGAKSTEANAKQFKRAHRALPKTESKFLSVTPSLSPKRPSPGSKFELTLAVDVKRGFHIQSNKPSQPTFIPADVFLERVDGLRFDDPVYPKPKFRKDKILGRLSEFKGKTRIRIPGEVDRGRNDRPATIAGIFTFQACNDKGRCFPPDAVSFSFSVVGDSLGDAGPAANQPNVLVAGSGTTGSQADSAYEEEPGLPEYKADGVGAVLGPTGGSGGEDGLEGSLRRMGLFGLLIACFFYGLAINATPCVLPLLSIKVLGFVQQAHESRRRTLLLGLAFGAGVLLFFVILGLLAAQGKNVLQYPVVVIALGAVVMALALSMLGVYTLQVPAAATSLDARIQQEGIVASFGKGALAPILGFACTGPLLAGAWAWATQQPPRIAILAFLSAGIGMASPYVLLGANPKWMSFLPKPGNWMITFERIMGFLLLAMVVLLIHPLSVQIGTSGLEWTLVFYVSIAMACWILGKIQITMPVVQRWRYRGGATAVVVIAGSLVYGWALNTHEGIQWQTWSEAAVEETVRSGEIVFVDFTAAYCTQCKVNKATAINTSEVESKFAELGVVAFRGDFTNGDEDIFEGLQKHGRVGVPLNLIYAAGRPDRPFVFEPALTKEDLLRTLDEAARAGTASASTAGS